MTSLKIVFAGTPEFALPCLETLHQSRHVLQAVYTQPDRPAGRGRKLLSSAVKTWAIAHHLPVYQPLNFRETGAVDDLASLNPDLLIVIAYGLILPKSVLSLPRLGCINVHGSLLPRWRGASPVQQAIWHGDRQSGVSIMQMDAGMDTGDILAEIPCAIVPGETAGTLLAKLAKLAAEPLISTLDALAAGGLTPKPQDNSLATYAGKINKEDAVIQWHQPAEEIDRLVRAFHPWPIAFTHAGEDRLRIHAASVLADKVTEAPGTILGIDRSGILVATGRDVLRVERIQFSGGKVLSVDEWLNSARTQLHVGLVLQ